MLRRAWRSFTVLAVAGAMLTALATPAIALQVAPDPLDWVTNGKTYALARSGDTIFVGGKFSRLRGPGGTTLTVANIVAIDAANAAPVTSFAATVQNTLTTAVPQVRALAVSADGSTLYIGGKFDTVDGQLRKNFAAVSTADGSLLSTASDFSNAVNAITVGPSKIYVGGEFKRVDGKPRTRLAALLLDGTLDDEWLPTADNAVRSLELATDGTALFVGGKFLNVNGTARTSVAKVSLDTGALDPWSIPAGVIDSGNPAWDLLATPTRLYGGFGNGPNYLAAFRLDNGSIGSQVWRDNFVGNVETLYLTPNGSRLFFGGHMGTGQLQQRVCGNTVNIRGLGSVNPATGQLFCDWIPQIEPFGSNFTGAWAMIGDGSQLWVAGFFTTISGVRAQGFARWTL